MSLLPDDLAAAFAMAADLLADEARQRQYLVDPAGWVRDVLGEYLWSKQVEVLKALTEHRRVAVKSAHGVGKSHVASRAVSWWLNAHEPGKAFVVTTAPTAKQVEAILWRYIGQAAKNADSRGKPFVGRVLTTEWKIDRELIAFGRKPADYDDVAFQGIHAEHVLVVLDEACHDDRTDVLTDKGWRRFADLDGSESLLTMDPETHIAEYQRPTRLFRAHRRGPMFEYVTSGASFSVTPNHRMYYRSYRPRLTPPYSPWRFAAMEDIARQNNNSMTRRIDWRAEDVKTFTIPETRTARKFFPERVLQMDDWMSFLGWYCSEGHIIKRRGEVYGAGISQKDDAVRAEIHDLCLRLGLPAKLYKAQVHIHCAQLSRHLAALGPNCLEKTIPDCVRMASARQINLFLDTFARGDGYSRGKREILYTSSPRMADVLHELCLKTGVNSTVTRRPLKGQVSDLGTHTATSTADGFVVTRTTHSTNLKMRPENLREVDYDGMVYCAEVPPHHLLMTRRDGKALWSGNSGIPEQLWTAADSLTSNDGCALLAIGNPADPASYFARACESWHTITISAFDTPNLTGEKVPDQLRKVLVSKSWVEEKRTDWGEDSPLWSEKVLGEFPTDASDQVVRSSDLAKCRQPSDRVYVPSDLLPVVLGVDVGGGGDETVIRERRGLRACREWRDRNDDTMTVVRNVLKAIETTGATLVNVDSIGIGAGVCDRLNELRSEGKHPATIVGVNVGQAATEPDRFANLRAELWWVVGRLGSERGEWDLSPAEYSPDGVWISGMENPDAACAQLLAPKWFADIKGRIQIEKKDDVRKRLGRSPDNADALLLSYVDLRGGFQFYMDQVFAKEAAAGPQPPRPPDEKPAPLGIDDLFPGQTASDGWRRPLT